uniref:Intraflagellar transport protein 46 homolog n=1 Tax=Bursaphelenchus xylophilus TaxID=6326 RepID=A0A1I7SM13_BURXY
MADWSKEIRSSEQSDLTPNNFEPDLDDFERQEKEIQDQLLRENPSGNDPNRDINTILEANEDEFTSDSVQNRQLSGLKENSLEINYSDESDYPDGYPPKSEDPPPAYSKDQKEESPAAKKISDAMDGERGIQDAMSGLVRVGGMAAAVATSAGVDSPRSDDTTNSFGNYRDDIRDQQNPTFTELAPTHRLSTGVKELFHLVEDFEADRIDIPSQLKPFLLDYLPAVGDVDPFLKIPRPDGLEDHLGLIELDEPAPQQSDSTIVDMKLRQAKNVISKEADAPAKRLERADKNTDQIDSWIKDIKDLRRNKIPDRVNYEKPMPDLEKLMQEWPPEMDTFLQNLKLPSASLDCTTEEYADICLSIMDIPVHKNKLHSLHVFFSLYMEFKNSQHFRQLASNHGLKQDDVAMDRLEL